MDLSAECIRAQLDRIEVLGWDSVVGDELLEHLRRRIVRPLVRRAGLTGPLADQAESSGWAAAWDALRRPSARVAENPAGMVWVAVGRAIRSEATGPAGPYEAPVTAALGWGETDLGGHLVDQPSHWPPVVGAGQFLGDRSSLGPMLDRVVCRLADLGWEPAEVRELVAALAEHSMHLPAGGAAVRWRLVARRLAVPEWRARRLASLLVGGTGGPGILGLMLMHGPRVLDEEAVAAAMVATTNSWSAVPEAHLAAWGSTGARPTGARPTGVPPGVPPGRRSGGRPGATDDDTLEHPICEEEGYLHGIRHVS